MASHTNNPWSWQGRQYSQGPQSDYEQLNSTHDHHLPTHVNPQDLQFHPTTVSTSSGIQHPLPISYASFPPSQYLLHQLASPMDDPFLTQSGPPQSRKPTTAAPQVADSQPNFPKYSPAALLNPRSAHALRNGDTNRDDEHSSKLSGGNDDSGDGDLNGEAPVMSNFLGDIHRVTEREAVHYRKRKSPAQEGDDESDEQGHKKAKSTVKISTTDGTIGAHLKAERERAAAANGPQSVVDLTNEDPEIIISGEGLAQNGLNDGNQEVCLGVLSGKANIARIPVYSQQKTAAVGTAMWPRTRLNFRRDPSQNLRIELLDRTQRVVGHIDYKIAAALCPLLDGQKYTKVRLTIWLHAWPREKTQQPGQHVSQNLNIAIVLYAPRKYKDMIGKSISQKSLWLESPNTVGIVTGKEHENPHVPQNFGPKATERRYMASQGAVMRTDEEIKRETETLFDSLVKHENLPELDADSTIIKTPLLSHQKQGLYFLLDHENSAQSNADGKERFSLWQPRTNAQEQQVWVNVITGHEEAKQPEPVKGGVLADMMGLGKTLSILSLIAQTKGESMEFGDSEPPRDSNVLRNVKGTLVVCPKSVMSNWQEQIRQHVHNNKLTFYNYHGSSRTQDVNELAKYDIVLTTYNTAASDFLAKDRALAAVNWFRIVLDEAHSIRNQNTAVSKACIDLAADRRWAVTGTPVQNGLGDLGALIKFLRVRPFDDAQTWSQKIILQLKGGNANAVNHLRLLVDSLTLRRLKDRIGLKGREETVIHLQFEPAHRKIYDELAKQSRKNFDLMQRSNGGRLRGKAYTHILKSINRMRMFCAHGLDMFSAEERKELQEGLNPENAISIDLGDEPGLEPYVFISDKQAYETLQLLNETDTAQCERCSKKVPFISDSDEDAEYSSEADGDASEDESGVNIKGKDVVLGYLNPCLHLYCVGCMQHFQENMPPLTADERYTCESCKTFIRLGFFELTKAGLHDYLTSKSASLKKRKTCNLEDYEGASVKVRALLEDLAASAAESAALPPGEPPIRSVVFSGWTTYLDLIEIALDEQGIGHTRLDGTMSVRRRSEVLAQFKSDPNITVILVSIKAGGQGLNFTAANKVYMMEPQYNPGVEQQAIDRVHRLGQKRDVSIKRYVMERSVEEAILELQRKKMDLAKFTLESKLSSREAALKRLEDFRALIR